MATSKINWYKIADHHNEIDFADNNLAIATAGSKKVCIGKYNDQLFAVAQKCPHAGGLMAHGYIDAQGHIVCPLHRYKFNPVNGRNVSGEGYYLKHWPVEERNDGVYVGIEATTLFGW